MSTTALPARTVPHALMAESGLTRFYRLAGWPFLAGQLLALFGLVWDIQWHDEVGPDTFFTLPHLVLYSGVALGGAICLAVLLAGAGQRGPGGPAAWLRGARSAPVGYLIGFLGTVGFLLYGLYDLWWHTVYGFDATVESPPHVGLLLCSLIVMVGCLSVQAAGQQATPQGWSSRIGLALAAAVLITTVTPWLEMTPASLVGIDMGHPVGVAALYSLALLLVAATANRPGLVVLTALLMTGLRLGAWFFAPWATSLYAGSLGLAHRDDATGLPEMAAMMPAYLLVAGLVIEGVLFLGRQRSWRVSLTIWLAAGLSAPLLLWLEATISVEPLLWRAGSQPSSLLLVGLVGALAGWFGWRLGIVLRRTTA